MTARPKLPPRRFAPLAFLLLLLAATARAAAADWDVLPTHPASSQPGVQPDAPVLVKSLGDATAMVARWRPPATAADWRARRPVVDRALRGVLGLDLLPPRTPLGARVIATHAFDGHAVDNVVFESRPGIVVTANLYRPTGPGPRRRPAVLSPIGHFLTPGKTAPEVQARCIGLARLGFVVLAYDALGQGERMVPGNVHHEAGFALLPLGGTIAGWMAWDSMRALDYLASRDDVDASRIGVTGNSGGGLNTLLVAALDDRVRAAAIAGFTFEFGDWLRHGGTHCTCTHWPGAFDRMNWFEVAGLAAPRAVLMLQGEDDGIFPVAGARRSADDLAAVYRAAGAPGRSRLTTFPGQPHSYGRPFREAMYGWMAWHLQGRGHGEPIPEGAVATLPANDPRLLCDPGRATPAGLTVVEWARRRAMETSAALRPAPARVRAWVRDEVIGDPDARHFLAARTVRSRDDAGGRLEFVAFNSEVGERIPALLWLPTNGTARPRCVVVADARGKAAVAASALPAAVVASGRALLAVDLRGRGETLASFGPGHDANFRLVANQVLSGRPLAGRRAFDLMRSIDYLASRPDLDAGSVDVAGLGDDALPALLAAVSDGRVGRVATHGFAGSFADLMRARTPPPPGTMGDHWNDPQLRGLIDAGDRVVDYGSVIPGALRVADVRHLAEAVAPRRAETLPDAGAAAVLAWLDRP